jgi:hypothetical protein
MDEKEIVACGASCEAYPGLKGGDFGKTRVKALLLFDN